MNVRRFAAKGLLSAAIAVGTVPLAGGHAFAGDNGGCGAGFTESTVSDLTAYAVATFTDGPTADQWAAFFTSVDKNGDGSLCWHPIGKTCPCGANAINVIDDNANATHE